MFAATGLNRNNHSQPLGDYRMFSNSGEKCHGKGIKKGGLSAYPAHQPFVTLLICAQFCNRPFACCLRLYPE